MKELASVDQFFFELPLYDEVTLPEGRTIQSALYGKALSVTRGERIVHVSPKKVVDGHCPQCGQSTTYHIHPQHIPNGDPWNSVEKRNSFDEVSLSCARNEGHVVRFYFKISGTKLVKIGQLPSLSDIANDEARTYRTVLSKVDAAELHSAIGLAAHGVGIGSFVYLRRTFERLIFNRFNEFKAAEGWDDESFKKKRMDEKVKFLKGHIPEFLFDNRAVYSILSKGIHELSDKKCLEAFDFLKLSIKIILEEDKKKQEELKLQQMAADAIRNFKA